MDPRLDRLHRSAAATSGILSLAGGLPARELLPREAIAAATAAALPDGDGVDALQYGWPEGERSIRAWIAERMRARGAAVDADDVIITAGAQQALSLIAALIPAGSKIGVDRETYPAALEAFTLAGHALHTTGDVELRYLIDGIDNPRGVDRVSARRAALLAARTPLVVDEAYAELRFDGKVARPLYADAPDRVWHVGSFSKIVSPGLRIGWLIAPRGQRDAALAHKQAADLQTGAFAQGVLARWLATADYDGLVERARNLYGARAERLSTALRRHLPGWRMVAPEGGFSIWVDTDLDGDELELLAEAMTFGVVADPGSMFRAAPSAADPVSFRLSFSHAPPHLLDEAIRRLQRAACAYRGRRRARAA